MDGRLWLFKLHPKAIELISKYGGVEKLPKISNSGYNVHLKEVARLAGITINLTVKIGRKTFTNTVLNELGVSELVVAAMLGHSDTKHINTTQK